MKTKKKTFQGYLKNLLAMTLILALVATNLLTSSLTVYAKETAVTSETTSSQTTSGTTSTDVTSTDTTNTGGTSTDTTSTDGTTTGGSSTDGTATTSQDAGEATTDTQTTDTQATDTQTTDTQKTDAQTTDSTQTGTTGATTTQDATNTTTDDKTSAMSSILNKTNSTVVKETTTGEKVLAEQKQYSFGTSGNINKSSLFDDTIGYGFSDVGFPNAAKGWDSNVYYPREAVATQGQATFVEDKSDSVAISSKVWTETENTGYGVYTYENTSTLDFNLEPANYKVKVTLTNPTSNEITAYLEAEDITKASDIKVAVGEVKEVEFTACLIDNVLNLKFLSPSKATSEADASAQTVYVKSVSLEKVTNEAGSKPTVFIASDSTVQTYDSSYYPQTGWGQTLVNFFGDFVGERECEDCNYSQSQTYETSNVIIENRAIGGRSSKSFVEEGKLDDLLEDIKPGDYLLVQWGHNDATYSRPNRYVSSGDFEKWMQYYVDGAKQRGATCVLVTPVARYSYKTAADGTLDSFASNFEDYRNVMKKMSTEQSVPLVDLTGLSIELCNSFGIEGAKSLFLMLAAGETDGYYAGGVQDSTHLQYYGAYKFAQCVAKGIKNNDQLTDLASKVSLTLPENKPAVPANLKKTTVGASSISLAWDKANDAELYYVYRQELAAGQTADSVDFSNATKYSVSSKNSYTDANCEGGKAYVYAVAGFNELGVGTLSDKITVSTKSSAYKFDFGVSASPNVMDGWTEVTEKTMYSKEAGYGFITSPGGGRNRANNGNKDSSAMADDFCLGAGEFALDVANGDYEVTIYACDLSTGTSTIKASYTGEGVAIGGISAKQALGSMTATVRVTDGQLNIGIGGTNAYINGMEVTPILGTPTQLSYSEMNFDNSQASFLINFTGIDEAVSYNIYQKASTDKTFAIAKTIQAADLSELGSRSMVAPLGETYQYYVTAVTSENKESAASNTIQIEMINKNVAVPAAPKNVKCDSAENGKITISWDSSSDAISYIIYRSDKAETDKGFKAFTKVGTSTNASFTDTNSDLTTNIHYYYKVQGKNAGGVGELSAACETPIKGDLIAAAPEKLTDRGVVAVSLAGDAGAATSMSATDKDGKEYTSGVYVSWRSFAGDFDSANKLTSTFTVYRNDTAIASNITVTNLVDQGGKAGDVYKVVGSNDASLGLSAKDTKVWNNQYLELQLFKPADETMPDGSVCNYTANDMSVGDVNGDGDYELFVKWYPSNAKDNSFAGYTGKSFIDAYDIDMQTGAATLLYRVDLGINIRSGAHYSPFQVWDFDGDGKAELAVKTADGTTAYTSSDGTDQGLQETGYVGACNASALPTDKISASNDYRNKDGYILNGKEYFTMFDNDGKILDTTDFIPERGSVSAWGDAYGNRVDRYLSAVAYLNGQTPCAVFSRGYYSRTCLTAYTLVDTNSDGIGDKLNTYWKFDTNDLLEQYDKELIEAQGNHNLSVNDIDNDGKDEIIYGSLVVDHDGTLKYSTGLGHGDAMHVADWVSSNPGLEIMQVHEHDGIPYHVEVHDAETGKILMGYFTGKDTGRGVMSDIDPTYPFAEFWSIASPSYVSSDEPSWDSKNGGVYSSTSTLDNLVTIAKNSPASNATIFWDGDLLSDVFDHTFDTKAYVPLTTTVAKWNYETSKEELLFETNQAFTSNGTKGNPGLIADLLGDWREEMVLRCSADDSKVRVYTTTIQTDYVVPCLMDNLAYREGVAWQNVGYNQPAHLDHMISENLITAQVSIAETTKNSITLNFTPANDGAYGHEIQGYEVYRTVADANNYTKVATINKDSLTVKAGTSGADTVYEYKDTSVNGGTSYLYKIAAIVDNKTSYMSRTASANSLVDIKSVKEFKLDSIVEDTVLQASQTVADLLPKTVTVVDSNNNEVPASVTWDVSAVDLSTPGTYKVIATIAGYDKNIETTLTIIENTITGYTAIADIKAVVGTTVTLPQTVEVNYLNGTKKSVNVVKWNGTLDTSKLGTYTLTAVLEDVSNVEVKVNVSVLDDYVTSVTGTLEPVEVVINSTITSSMLPATINAKYASGTTGAVAITWDTNNLDTSAEGVISISGSVAGYDSQVNVLARVVKYPALYKFDFGITGSAVATGWTGITVNPKGGTTTAEGLGIAYTSDKGYGFDSASSVINGRAEAFSYTDAKYPMPSNVYGDFGLLAGNTFSAAVANGKYSVEIMSNSTLKGDAKGTIEGTAFSFSSAANKYAIGVYETEVTDGKLSIAFTGTNARIGAVIIRSMNETKPTTDPVVEKFTATFNSNGGSEVTAQTIEKGKLVTLTADPVKDGYTFDGWYKDSALTTKWNFATDTVTADTTLFAKWNVIAYAVTFNSNGGSEVGAQTIESGKIVSEPTAPAKSGYTFAGWYKETSLATAWNFASDTITANTILYAKWNAIMVSSIKLDEESLTIGTDTKVVLKATVAPTDAANSSVLWSSSNSDVASVDQSGVVNANKMGTVTITATSADGSNIAASCNITVGYKITYVLNGGTNHEDNPTGFAAKTTVKLLDPVKSGYTFKGWYTDKNFKKKITKITKGTKKNVTVYAKWEKITVAKASIDSLKNSSKGKMKIKLDKVNGAKGYEIVYATDSKFSTSVENITLNSSSKTISNLTKGTTYYVKARAYKVDNSGNKIYGKYSSVKKVTIKK